MIVSSIRNNIPLFSKKYKTHLGRWNLDYYKDKVDSKVDLANEDHCGVCSEYSKKTLTKRLKEKKN